MQTELSKLTQTETDLIYLNNLYSKDPAFAYEVVNKGELVVNKRPEIFINFKKRVLLNYIDTHKLRQMMNQAYLRRLKQLENNISELKDIKQKYSVTNIKRDKKKEWALRYGLLESIQVIIDISCHLVVQQNLGNAETYADCIALLSKFDYINQDLADKLIAMTGLRNILVH